jgi:hypothetical protein
MRRAWAAFVTANPKRNISVPAIASATGSDTWYASPAGSNSISAPITNMTAPATESAPWETMNPSATKNAAARIISSRPAAETGSTWSP